ncbi:MAG TPA: hypothetical protein VGI60_05070 [Chthoniobacterales bacterium]|jgi:hypothetical protein
MKKVMQLALVLGLSLQAASAQEPMAKARAHLEVKGELLVGQRVILVVELLAPGFFSGTAAYNLPSVPGVLLIPPTGSPVVSSTEENGISYTLQRHEFSVFVRRAGQHEIPAFPIRLQFKRNALDEEPVEQTVQATAIQFVAKSAPGAEDLGAIICARELKIEERWNPEPGKAKAGDAFTRMITFSAPDVPAMAFPAFPTGTIDGLGIYPKAPEVLDKANRGTLLGQRRDTLTYVCERPGRFVIPAVKLTWWDLDTQQLRTEKFSSRTIEVAPNPALPSGTALTTSSRTWQDVVTLLGMIALAPVALVLRRKIPFARLWRRIIDPFRPIRLQPLNPVSRSSKG